VPMPTSITAQRVLALIPSYVKRGIEDDVAADRHPQMDYDQLVLMLRSRGCKVDVLDYSSLRNPRLGLKDLRLAILGYTRRRRYDAIFCNSESIALPLGTIIRTDSRRPRIVAIGHRISTPKKRVFFTSLSAADAIDSLFLYASSQLRYAGDVLHLPPEKTPLTAFHADCRFFRPIESISAAPRKRRMVSAAGLEWRDYPTLIEVAHRMPDVDFHIAAASPWSKHKNEAAGALVPENVTVRRHDYDSLRTLYLSSDCVAVPLYETDFQAGVTTILEAMACGRPVVTSNTTGQTDVIRDGENGMYAKPGDPAALQTKIEQILNDPALSARLSTSARSWVENNASLELWAQTLTNCICSNYLAG
jgi:glycosyltransferase involved in cell wall biosynthesis